MKQTPDRMSRGAALFQWRTPTLAFSPSGQGLQRRRRAVLAGLQPAPFVDTGFSPWPPARGKVPFRAGFSRASRSSGFIQSLPPKRSHTHVKGSASQHPRARSDNSLSADEHVDPILRGGSGYAKKEETQTAETKKNLGN